jgi:hypothetical protein
MRQSSPDWGRTIRTKEHLMKIVNVQTLKVVALSALLAAGSANAGLVGDTVTAQMVPLFDNNANFPGDATTIPNQFNPTAVVGAGVEFSGQWAIPFQGVHYITTVDLSDNAFTVTMDSQGSSHGIFGPPLLEIDLGSLDLGSDITGVTLSSGYAGVIGSTSFTKDSVKLVWTGFWDGNFGTVASWTFDLKTAAPPAAISEPASTTIVALGLLGVALTRRKACRA